MSVKAVDPCNGGYNFPAENQFAITPSDTDELVFVTRAVYVGTGGNISVITGGDTVAVVWKNVADGSLLPIRAKQVKATGTTATDLIGLY